MVEPLDARRRATRRLVVFVVGDGTRVSGLRAHDVEGGHTRRCSARIDSSRSGTMRRPRRRGPARRAAKATDASECRNELTELGIVEHLVERLAERVAAVIVERLSAPDDRTDEWFNSRSAAEYLGIHRDTLRKLAAERAIPTEQDGPGCKLYFRRSDLDAWRRSGGRPRQLTSNLDLAA